MAVGTESLSVIGNSVVTRRELLESERSSPYPHHRSGTLNRNISWNKTEFRRRSSEDAHCLSRQKNVYCKTKHGQGYTTQINVLCAVRRIEDLASITTIYFTLQCIVYTVHYDSVKQHEESSCMQGSRLRSVATSWPSLTAPEHHV